MRHRELELVGAVRRVDVDEDRADASAGELEDRPFRAVGGPDADSIAFLDSEREQAPCDPLDLSGELGIGETHALMNRDQGFVIGHPRHRLGERITHRVTE